jgi:hypothetical protein
MQSSISASGEAELRVLKGDGSEGVAEGSEESGDCEIRKVEGGGGVESSAFGGGLVMTSSSGACFRGK